MRTMWHRLTSGIALSLMLGALSGCGGELKGNGKNAVLYFARPANPMSRHLENSILLPSSVTEYPGRFELPKSVSYDFRNTTLDVTVAEGIELLGTTYETQEQGPNLWRIRIRCQTPPGVVSEVSVRVMDGKHVRYADAIDITCVEPQKLSVKLLPLKGEASHIELTPKTVIQGGNFLANVQLWGKRDDGREFQLSGSGIEVADPLGPVSIVDPGSTWPDEYTFRAERLGQQPLLKAGPLTAPIPIEVVPNEGWSLRARTAYSVTSGVGFLYLSGAAEFPDGGVSAGLAGACTITRTPEGGTLNPELHTECAGRVTGAPDAGEVCIEALGRKGCSTY